MKTIDLRSDTVTQPTTAMREAMAEAVVGDDVYGEDPTVVRLQERVSALLGKEAALFFPSGTMANQAALRLHTRPGDVVLGTSDCHILRYESGAASALSGLQIKTIGTDGGMSADAVRRHRTRPDPHVAPTTLVALENTHNAAGGRVMPLDTTREVAAATREAGMALHLDGARLWNAAVAQGSTLAELAGPFDTVSVCLSKGLGAPAGSVVAGERDAIGALLRIRKMLGGGMRQVGVLAAAGLHALDHHLERLVEDHENARALASGLAALGFEVECEPETNIVLFRPADPEGFPRWAEARALRVNAIRPGVFRAVTHLGVTREDVSEALARLEG